MSKRLIAEIDADKEIAEIEKLNKINKQYY
jgi:hypothetical protein